MLLYVNVNASKAWIVTSLSLPISSPQLTATAGNYAYVNLRLLGGIDVDVAPGRRHHRPLSFTLTYLFFYLLVLGTLAPLGQASKFLFFSAGIADGPHCFWLPLRLWPASMPTAFLYGYGLPLRLRQAERLSFSLCDLYFFFPSLNHFLFLF